MAPIQSCLKICTCNPEFPINIEGRPSDVRDGDLSDLVSVDELDIDPGDVGVRDPSDGVSTNIEGSSRAATLTFLEVC